MVDYLDLEGWVSWPGITTGYLSTNELDNTIDADGEKVGYTVRAPKAGTIDAIVFHTGTVTQDPSSGVKVSFQGVTGATGLPDGTPTHYRVKTTMASDTSHETGLITDDGTDNGNKKTVTAGELFSVVIEFESFDANDKLEIRDRIGHYDSVGYAGAVFLYTAAWAAASTANVNILLKYDDGTYETFSQGLGVGSSAAGATNQKLWDVNTDPDEVGVKFTAPYNCKLHGIHVALAPRNETFNVVLYNASDTVIDTLVYGTDLVQFKEQTSAYGYVFWFATPPELTSGDVYRVTLLPSTDTGVQLYVKVFTYANAACIGAQETNYILTSRVDAGAWTDTALQRPAWALLLSHAEEAGVGGAFQLI